MDRRAEAAKAVKHAKVLCERARQAQIEAARVAKRAKLRLDQLLESSLHALGMARTLLVLGAKQDRDRIDIDEDDELRDWAKSLGVSEDELRRAVAKAGPMVRDVKAHLKLHD
jgi:uncharacterized protein DUF3606